MDHIEVATTLDVETTAEVLGDVLARRRFRLEWENGYSATARKGLRRLEMTLFSARPGHTVLQITPNAVGSYYFGDLVPGVWLDVTTDRLATKIAEALTEREMLSGKPFP